MKGAFLVNTSRSGSTMMSTILRQHPEILSISELLTTQGSRALVPGAITGRAFWRQLSAPTPVMRQLANPQSAPNEFLYHKVPEGRFDPFDCPPIQAVTLPHLFDDPDAAFDRLAQTVSGFDRQRRADHYRALFEHLGAVTGTKVWVERSGGTLMATQTLARQFPEAKFALILRDGRDVVLSMQRYKPARFLIWFWKRAKQLGIDVFRPGAHIGNTRWIALVERLSGRAIPVQRILNTQPSLEDTAACWSAMMASGIKQFMALPANRRMVIRYEQLTQDPKTNLSRLARFLELTENPAWLDFGVGVPRVLPARHLRLPPSERLLLDKHTSIMREASQYLC